MKFFKLVFFVSVFFVFPLFALGPAFKLVVFKTNLIGANGSEFAVGDVDGDGKNDVIINRYGQGLFWRQYPKLDSDYTIDTRNDHYGGEIQVADVDNDGDIDVICPDQNSNQIYWWENPRKNKGKPDGNPKTDTWVRHTIGSWGTDYPHDCKIGDVNGDGKIDVIINCNYGTYANPDFYVFIQNSPDSWTKVDVGPLRSTEGSWVADINKDGRQDLIDGMDWYEAPANPVTGQWVRHHINNFPTGLMRTNVGDLLGNGRLDVITSVSEYQVGPLAWYESPADIENGTWTEHVLVPAADLNYHTLQIGDMDGDGKLDIVTGSTHGPNSSVPYAKCLRIFYNQGNGIFKDTTWQTQYGVWNAIIGDVGSKGTLDILNCDYGAGAQEELWENQLTPPQTGVKPALKTPARLKSKFDGKISGSLYYLPNGRVTTNDSKVGRVLINKKNGEIVIGSNRGCGTTMK
ncbi:MAG: VCBS repeat-containing protein [Chitinivibrionales bacterium]|nr:VCBS repeat-containing protein [Chitinivibrionales bacterium]